MYAWESWALAYFLDRQESAARRGVSTALVGDMLASRKETSDWLEESFRSRLGLRSEADWAALDREFGAFALDLLLRAAAEKPPAFPALEDWPGYVEPDDLG